MSASIATTAAPTQPPPTAVRSRVAVRRVLGLTIGTVALAALCCVSVALGTRGVGPADIVDGLAGRTDTIAASAVAARLPRTALALLVGASLSVSGATLQAITRNPLAEPAILGISGGAALAVVIGIALFGLADPYGLLVVAIAGAAAASLFVYSVGSVGRAGATPLKLALAGAATSAACSSLTSAILLPRIDAMFSFRFWQIGGVGGATWDRIAVVAPFLAAGVLLCVGSARGLNLLALGDDTAAGLGADVPRTRLVAGLGAVLLCGVATSVAGPIAFVGLVVPHLCRRCIGSDHRWLLPAGALGGALLLLAADIVGRVVARPEEIEVGILTAFIGAPVLVWVAARQRSTAR